MKYILILSVIALLVLTGCGGKTINPATPGAGNAVAADFTGSKAIDTTQSTLEFEGYAIAKSHIGTFSDWQGELLFEQGKIVGAQGVIQASSVTVGIEGLENHLRSDDFFDVEKYPTITITSTSLADGIMTANLQFRGITKSISFPVVVSENSLSTDFILDTSDFAMKYVGVKQDVRIAFTMVV